MSEMIEIVRLDPARRSQAAETLVRAFREDPMYTYMCPDEAGRVIAMRALWDAVLAFALIYGKVWTTPDVRGVACWLSPGHTTITPWQMVRTGFALPRAMLRFPPDARRRAIGVFDYAEQLHRRAMRGRHWYLWALGVEPYAQGRGIGSSLLGPVLARADATGLPCYLETESEPNVAFYRRHGFEVVTAARVPGHALALWTMAREPHSTPGT